MAEVITLHFHTDFDMHIDPIERVFTGDPTHCRLLVSRVLLLILSILSMVGCHYNDVAEPQIEHPKTPPPTMKIGDLRARYQGAPVAVRAHVVVAGYVTTSDLENNFYRSFVIEDESGAVEIKAGLYDLHNLYRLHQYVAVKAEGLMLGMESGLLQLGLVGGSTSPIGYMDHRVVLDRYVYRGKEHVEMKARPTTPDLLQPQWLGTLVRIDRLRLASPSDTTWALAAKVAPLGVPQSVNLKFRTHPRDSIFVFTSGYAHFAQHKVPQGELSIQGVLMRGKVNGREVYQLKMRDLNDLIVYDE